MDIQSILKKLEYLEQGQFPRAELKAAASRQEEITPFLLEVLKETVKHPEEIAELRGYMAHIYAIFLLAQFRETRAYPLLVELVSTRGDVPDCLFGDLITEDLARLLASVCGDDPSLIQQLIENANAGEYVREAGINALIVLFANQRIDRKIILEYFRGLFHGGLESVPSQVWNGLVSACADLSATELRDEIERAYEHGLVWPGFVSPRDIQEAFSRGVERMTEHITSKAQLKLVEDPVREMEWWAGFKQEKIERREISVADTKSKKIGRNQPCPCGSGKKYKKCCGSPQGRAGANVSSPASA